MTVRVVCAEAVAWLREQPENSFAACCTDPPYGLEFMGRDWDAPWQLGGKSALFGKRKTATPDGWGGTRNANCRRCGGRARGAKICQCAQPDWDEVPEATRVRQMRAFQDWCEEWALEVYRVLKPVAHLVAFGGTRTYHRMVCAIEDAGFEIRDSIGDIIASDTYVSQFMASLSDEQQRAFMRCIDESQFGGLLAWVTAQGFPKGLHIVNKLISMSICQKSANAHLVVQTSASIRASSGAEREPIAVALAQILPAGEQVLLTATGAEVALHVPMDTWPSGWETRIGLSTTWSWNGSLEEACIGASKSIIATISETTIDRKTWLWLTGLHTSATTTQCNVILPNGSKWPAITVASDFNGGGQSRRDIQIVTALGDAGWNPVVRFDGFNVALKPSWEPIVLARKPLSEGTVAANVLKWGTGALNIDAARVATSGADSDLIRAGVARMAANQRDAKKAEGWFRPWMSNADDVASRINATAAKTGTLGRWPANLALSYPEDEYELRCDITAEQRKELFRWFHENA